MTDPISVVRTDSGQCPAISRRCRDRLFAVLPGNAQYVEVRQSADVRGHYRNIFCNVLCGLNQCRQGQVFIVEYDCLYPAGYFDRRVDEAAIHVTRDMLLLNATGFFWRDMMPSSTIIGDRELLRDVYWDRISRWHEAGRKPYIVKSAYGTEVRTYSLDVPAVDIRHGHNFTHGREPKRHSEYFSHHPYWGRASELYRRIVQPDAAQFGY